MLLFWLMLNCVCLRAGGRLASHWPATVKECDSIVYMLEQGSGCATARQSMLVRRLYGVSRKYPGNKAVRWRALYWDAVDKNDRMMPALADSLLGAAGRLVDSVAYEYDYRRIRRSAALVRLRSPGQMYNLYRAQLKAHLDADVGWGTFRQAFEQVYPSFFTRLKERHPVLTDYDVRLCAYIVAGADNKQISMLLNILPESLKKSRTRLRKKLGIGAGDSLADYLRGFNGA